MSARQRWMRALYQHLGFDFVRLRSIHGAAFQSVLSCTGRKSNGIHRGNELIKRSMLCVAIFHFSRLLGHYRSAVYQ